MKIGLLGYGKMGRAIEEIARAEGDEIVLRVDVNNAKDIGPEELKACEVLIEFTRPEAAFDNIRMALEAGVPIVSGTTGWLDRWPEVRRLCEAREGAFFYASNFSLGVNILFALNRYLARLMNERPEYEVALKEIHHIHKLDAPSGTAVTLAEGILQQLDRKTRWTLEAEPGPEDIGITAIREDEVPGTHEVTYRSGIDTLYLRHEAHSREGFARGALLAARWLPGRQGVFGMQDLLGLD